MKTIKSGNESINIPTSSEWPLFEVLVNPRHLNLKAVKVIQERKSVGLLLPRPVRVKSALPPSPSAHKNRHPPPSYLAFCQYHKTFTKYIYFYPGVVEEVEPSQNGTLAFYYDLYNGHNYYYCTVYVMAALNSRLPPPPPVDHYRQFHKL